MVAWRRRSTAQRVGKRAPASGAGLKRAVARIEFPESTRITDKRGFRGDMKDIAEPVAMPLRGTRAAMLPLIGGRLCLDFTNTAHGRGTAGHTENLVDYGALIAWSRHARAIDARRAEALAKA